MLGGSAAVHHVLMDQTGFDTSESSREALAWFGIEPGPDDWVNATWIGRNGSAELRIVDVAWEWDGVHDLALALLSTPGLYWTCRCAGVSNSHSKRWI